MNRQNTSRSMFGPIMLAVALLLVACGSGDSNATPTPTTGADAAVPTLPVDEAAATAAETESISEEDLTVVTPDLPATAATSDGTASVKAGTPPASVVEAGTATSAETATTEAAVVGTPAVPTASTPGVEPATSMSTPAVAEQPTQAATPDTAVPDPADSAAATPAIATEGGSFDTPGDGTGGSGQPGERSSNLPDDASPAASPVAFTQVEGCNVPDVPAFTGDSTSYITVAEVNFRSGPGTDCPPILETPLGEGVAVTVLGGPVTQAEDDSNWLQVEVDGVPGWVSLEFVEPVD